MATTTYSPDELAILAENKVSNVKKFLHKYCCHTAGNKWRGQPFKIISWQDDAINKIFGTLKPDGTRQYRTAYIEIPKKNGKTEFAAALSLY
jgi:phage terminase large subunit-like protein